MRILVVNWLDRENPAAGGAEIHLHETFGRLAGRGHDVTVLASGWRGAPARAELDGIAVHRAAGRYTFGIAAPFHFRKHLAHPFDVVVEDLNKVPLFTPLWTDAPVVLLVHHLFGRTAFREASPPVAAATWLLERPIPLLYRRVPVVAVSASTAEDLVHRGLAASRIRVIPNGVDTGRLTPLEVEQAGMGRSAMAEAEGGAGWVGTAAAADASTGRYPEPSLLYLGRLQRYKRVDLVVRAVDRLRDAGVFCRLRIAGKGGRRQALESLTRRLELEDRVDFLGFVDEEEKRELLRRSWVHVLTSPREGWGIANLEAAACGTPTVASDSPGLRDSVRDGETGFLVPHGDVAALADRLRSLLLDADLRQRMGGLARRFAEGYSWDETATRVERALHEATLPR